MKAHRTHKIIAIQVQLHFIFVFSFILVVQSEFSDLPSFDMATDKN